MKKISVIGLGKLGLPLAAAIASRGYSVTGFDNDSSRLAAISAGDVSYEPGLKEFISANSSRLEFVNDLEPLLKTSITFVVVPTPSLKNGAFSLKHIERALAAFGRALRKKKTFHILAVVSTVLPGDMARLARTLERASGKTCGKDFGFLYNPAFIALGSIIQNFLHPDFVLIGELDARSGGELEDFYLHFCRNQARIHRMNWVNAELVKIAVNTFVTMKISFGNTLARICEQLTGAHSEIVTQAIGSDRRIGTAYLKGALGYGGPCFPRDNKAFSHVARRAGLTAHLSEATDRTNAMQVELLARIVTSQSRAQDRIAVLGLSYKPDTPVIEESQGIGLVWELLKRRRRVLVYDPVAIDAARPIFGKRVQYAKSLAEAIRVSDVIVITTPWKDFRSFQAVDFVSMNGHPKKIIDPWRVVENGERLGNAQYIPLGVDLNRMAKEKKA